MQISRPGAVKRPQQLQGSGEASRAAKERAAFLRGDSKRPRVYPEIPAKTSTTGPEQSSQCLIYQIGHAVEQDVEQIQSHTVP